MLYFVSTPIGNLKDISYRAVETLRRVDEIACEDTRRSLTLLNAYGIKKPLFSYHKYNEKEAGEKIIEKLKSGLNVAVISDAGMPVISDPGNVLCKTLRENGLEYTVVPGANAALSALILSGKDCSRFCFLGFLTGKESEKKKLLERYKNVDSTLVFYSAPHDVKKDVKTLYSVLGERICVAVKEITKIHERAVEFNLKDGFPEEPKGEFVLVVEGGKEEKPFVEMSDGDRIASLIEQGVDKKEAIKIVAKERGVAKSSLYKYTIREKE